MRTIHRIQNFIDKVNWFDLIHNQWNIYNSKLEAYDTVKAIELSLTNIKEYWELNPDLRISQVLISMSFIPNKEGMWYYMEESEILEAQVYSPEEYLFWTSLFDKDGNKLEKPITRLVKDLTKEHIRAIKKYNEERKVWLPTLYNQAFNNVLNK